MSTQLVLVVPALLVLALLVVQFALVWHARHVAHFAAQRALAVARAKDGTAGDGRVQARRTLAGLGSRVLTAPSVDVSRSATQTTARIRGTVMSVVPGLTLHASGIASGPTERVTSPVGARP